MDVIFDIDGTLADASHRLHLIQRETKDWENFLSPEEVERDTVIEPVAVTLLAMSERCRIAFVTGRPERLRETTAAWLVDVFGQGIYLHGLLRMRPDDDRRPSVQIKREALAQLRAEGFDPKLAFEDRASDAAMYREEGLIVAQVNEGAY